MAPKKSPFANQLFVQWLEEWKRQARDRHIANRDNPAIKDTYWALARAHQSMLKYPHPLATGWAAAKVKDVGPHIACQLQKRMEIHCDAGTLSTPATTSPTNRMPNMERNYLPRPRSAPYAILLALLKSYREGKQTMTKANIVKDAASFCLTAPSSRFSAMAGLMRMGLIRMNNSYYSLTKEGVAVADMLVVRGGENVLKIAVPRTTAANESEQNWPERLMEAAQEERAPSSNHGHNAEVRPLESPRGNTQLRFDSRLLQSPMDLALAGSRVSPWQRQPSLAPLLRSLSAAETSMPEKATPAAASGDPSRLTGSSTSLAPPVPQASAACIIDATQHYSVTALNGGSSSCPVGNEPALRSGERALLLAFFRGSRNVGKMSKLQTLPGKTSAGTSSIAVLLKNGLICKNKGGYDLTDIGHAVARKLSGALESDSDPVPNDGASPEETVILPQRRQLRETSVQPSSKIPCTFPSKFKPIVFPARTYDIVCLVDTRERNFFPSKLAERGVCCELRQLQLGDVIWVARQRGTGRELVLDFVVERKTTSDLLTSIKDGRSLEQRFRLTHSAARNMFYIVEHSNLGAHYDLSPIYSIMAKLQIRDGVIVKRTGSVDESVTYIERLTRILERSLKGHEILGIPDNLAHGTSILETKQRLAELNPGKTYHLTFSSYQHLNSKTCPLTLRDLLIKFLICIKWMGSKNASELASLYKTPKGLMEAFDAQETWEAKEDMLWHVCSGNSSAGFRKDINRALSRKVAKIWCQKEYSP